MSEPEPVLAARDRDRPASLDAIELESFHRARRFLSSILDLDELLRALLEEGLGAVGGTRGFVGLVNRPRAELDLRITAGKGWDTLPIRSMQIQAGPGSGITLQVVRTGEPYLTGDVRNDPYYRMFFPDVRSELAVPLLNRDGIALGVLNIESEEVNAFSYRDLQLLMALANQAAIAVSVARLRVRETALLEVGQELTSAVSMEELLQCVVRAARDLVRADDCSVFQLDEEGEYLTLRAAGELLQPHVGTLRYRVGEGLTGWVGQSGTAVRVPDVRADARWVDVFPPLPAGTVETFLATPVFARGALWGVLRAVRRQPAGALIPHTFSRRDEEFAQLLAGQMGAALTRQTLVEQQLKMERMAAWGEMSARAAHMMGNKLFALRGQLNELEHLARGAAPSGPDVLSVVVRAKSSTTQLEEILGDFRDFLMATSLQRAWVDLNEVVRKAAGESLPRNGAPVVRTELAADLPPVYLDASRFQRVLSELLENAAQHQGGSGEISLRTAVGGADCRSECPAALAAVAGSGRSVCVEVRDQGPGVSAAVRRRLFDPFFTTRAKGMGLGLSIVKGIVEAHGGAIAEVGVEGEGARFLIVLPAGTCPVAEGENRGTDSGD